MTEIYADYRDSVAVKIKRDKSEFELFYLMDLAAAVLDILEYFRRDAADTMGHQAKLYGKDHRDHAYQALLREITKQYIKDLTPKED